METIKDRFRDTLTMKQVADEFGIKESTLRVWRHRGEGPKSFTLGSGRMVRYLRADVEAWMEARYAEAVGA